MNNGNITYEWDGDFVGWVAKWHDSEQGYMTARLLPGRLVSPLDYDNELRSAAEVAGAPAGLPVERPVDPNNPEEIQNMAGQMWARHEATGRSNRDLEWAAATLEERYDQLMVLQSLYLEFLR